MKLDPAPFLVSFQLALATTAILIAVCLPLVRLRLFTSAPWAAFLESLAILPMVLPPTVIGFYFLAAFSPTSPLGSFFEWLSGSRILFSFGGLVFASSLVCFPFMYQTLKASMLAVDPRLIETSYTLGKGRLETFARVIVPNMVPGIVSGVALTFAHAVGEFGVALMVGGGIEGSTKTASIALYESVEGYDYEGAHMYAIVLLAFSWLVVGLLGLSKGERRRLP